MKELFVSYIYRLRHDIAFRITLFVGIGLALLMSLLYWGLGKALDTQMISGQMMLYSSLSPVQNFGIAIPVNLITFTVLEFSQGSIRNKIIAGHSKSQVYTSLVLNGLVFTFILVGVYVGLCFGLGCLFGIHEVDGKWVLGFEPNGAVASISQIGSIAFIGTKDFFLGKVILIAVFSYASIVSFTIFFATLFRNIGPSIPVIIVGLMICYLAGLLVPLFVLDGNETVLWIFRIVDPLYGLGCIEPLDGSEYQCISNETLICSLCSNLFYATAFYVGGLFIFKNRDVK